VTIQGAANPQINGQQASVLRRILHTVKGAAIEAYEVLVLNTGEAKKLRRKHLEGGARQSSGSLTSINLLMNEIPVKQAQALVETMQAQQTLTTLCGVGREESELDFSSQGIARGRRGGCTFVHNHWLSFSDGNVVTKWVRRLGAGDAVLIANDIKNMDALTKMNLSGNSIGTLAYPDGWKSRDNDDRAPFVGPDGQHQNVDPRVRFGVIALAGAIKSMALSSLDLSSNHLHDDGAKIIAEAIKVTNVCYLYGVCAWIPHRFGQPTDATVVRGSHTVLASPCSVPFSCSSAR
jgi:hypothetical protein